MEAGSRRSRAEANQYILVRIRKAERMIRFTDVYLLCAFHPLVLGSRFGSFYRGKHSVWTMLGMFAVGC
jgi:hypothetical protein